MQFILDLKKVFPIAGICAMLLAIPLAVFVSLSAAHAEDNCAWIEVDYIGSWGPVVWAPCAVWDPGTQSYCCNCAGWVREKDYHQHCVTVPSVDCGEEECVNVFYYPYLTWVDCDCCPDDDCDGYWASDSPGQNCANCCPRFSGIQP